MPATDFDVLIGTWRVEHERLADPFDPRCSSWLRFTSTAEVDAIPDGLGSADQTRGTLPDGARLAGFSLRLYAPESDEWSIWWASTHRPGVLDDPVRGRFHDGVGTFVGEAQHGETRHLARFRWSGTTTSQPIWSQDFSFDDGLTWAPVNWQMTHTRQPP
ncbi:MAG: hypothetical protein ACRCSN_21470 [Dermatophilaceae bacterium]